MTRPSAQTPSGSPSPTTDRGYDLTYLALAQRLGTRVVTADQRLVDALVMTDQGDLVVPLTNRTGDG